MTSAGAVAPPHTEESGGWEVVRRYHAASKHDFDRLARNHGTTDWATQPNPFRRYAGAPILPLPFNETDDTPPYEQIYEYQGVRPHPLNVEGFAKFFQLSLGISAWKTVRGRRWPLRVNPSSGNLHPSECYAVAGPIAGADAARALAAPAVFHYDPSRHALELRTQLSTRTWRALMSAFPPASFLVCLTSIYWREIWKYGERAYRYCQHDIGHALAALRMSAATLGWRLIVLEDIGDADIARLLGLDRIKLVEAEREYPAVAAAVLPDRGEGACALTLPRGVVKKLAEEALWLGDANALSVEHFSWDVIGQVAEACFKPGTNRYGRAPAKRYSARERATQACGAARTFPTSPSAGRVIRGRRSADELDSVTEMDAIDFYNLSRRLMPRRERNDNAPPWDGIRWEPCVHLGLFLHRVAGMVPGIYLLARDRKKVRELRSAMRPEFAWEKPPNCPADLPLYLLRAGDCQRLSRLLSCGQSVASDAVFSLAMVAEFERPLKRLGAWHYRRLFWEAGLIGQVLYLEAEALELRGTGIGCFFDDATHEVFGLVGWQYQCVYNFAIGGVAGRKTL